MIFQDPLNTHLVWGQVLSLFGVLGHAEARDSDLFVFRVGRKELRLLKPHTKNLTAPVVLELRRFLIGAGVAPGAEDAAAGPETDTAPGLVVVVERSGVRIYRLNGETPYDPEHVLHHLARKASKEGPGESGGAEERLFELVAVAASAGGRIVVKPGGEAQVAEADRLAAYLKRHHPKAYGRVVIRDAL